MAPLFKITQLYTQTSLTTLNTKTKFLSCDEAIPDVFWISACVYFIE